MIMLKYVKSIRGSQGQPHGHVTLQAHRSPGPETTCAWFHVLLFEQSTSYFHFAPDSANYVVSPGWLSIANYYCLGVKGHFKTIWACFEIHIFCISYYL